MIRLTMSPVTTETTLPTGQRIKQAREEKGLTQRELAELVGTSRRHVIRWEQGRHLPSRVYAVRLAGALGRQPEFFQQDNNPSADMIEDLILALEIVKQIRAGKANG